MVIQPYSQDVRIMGTLHRFPLHGRASLSRSARDSRVTSEMPRSDASRAKGNQCFDGMPRTRQRLTAGGFNASAEATALVPPRASMTESDVIMPGNLVCTMQTRQGFANGKTTSKAQCAVIPTMTDAPKIIGNRLEALRKELGFKTQDTFAEKLGIDKSTYSLIKNGKRNLSFETACVIRREWGISIDWLFFGDLQQSAIQTMAKIGRGAPPEPAKRKAG